MGSVYFVGVHTGTASGSGTGNAVSIAINSSKSIKLDDSKNNFENDDYDSFAIKPEIDEDINQITLSLGDTGGTKWYCDYVIVSSWNHTAKKFKVEQFILPGQSVTKNPMS